MGWSVLGILKHGEGGQARGNLQAQGRNGNVARCVLVPMQHGEEQPDKNLQAQGQAERECG